MGFCWFFQLNFNKLYPKSVTKIVGITYAIYQRISKRRLCKECIGRKVNNVPGAKLCWNFAFAHTPSFSPRCNNLTWASTWSAVITWPWWALTLSLWYCHVIYWSTNTLFWQLSINHNMDDRCQLCATGAPGLNPPLNYTIHTMLWLMPCMS